MWNPKSFIRDVVTPLSGLALMFYLVATPGERPSYFIAAAGLIGLPVALRAKRDTTDDE